MFDCAAQGKVASVPGNPDLPPTYTYVDDFAQTLVVLGERDEALEQVWHAPNTETVTTRQFVTLIYEELGQPPKMSGMGWLMMSIGGLFIPEAREVVEMMYEFEKRFVVDSSKFTNAFSFQGTPLREAIKTTVAWYKANFRRGKMIDYSYTLKVRVLRLKLARFPSIRAMPIRPICDSVKLTTTSSRLRPMRAMPLKSSSRTIVPSASSKAA